MSRRRRSIPDLLSPGLFLLCLLMSLSFASLFRLSRTDTGPLACQLHYWFILNACLEGRDCHYTYLAYAGRCFSHSHLVLRMEFKDRWILCIARFGISQTTFFAVLLKYVSIVLCLSTTEDDDNTFTGFDGRRQKLNQLSKRQHLKVIR